MRVPETIWNQFGIYSFDYERSPRDMGLSPTSSENYTCIKVDQDEVLIPDDYYEKINESKASHRLDALRNFKDNDDLIKQAEADKKQAQINTLISRIQALEPRIRELITTGNACLKSNIPLTGKASFGMREDYDTNQFFTNSWSHLVGFAGNPHQQSSQIKYLGINGGGACGVYHFRTDGINVFSVHERDLHDHLTPSIGHMERFLSRFDDFETAFYAYVDKTIENQKQSVDKLIASAQTKVAGNQSISKQNAPEKDR